MSEKAKIYNEIQGQYEKTRLKNQAEAKRRHDELVKASPRVLEIEKEIKSLGITATKEAMLNPESYSKLKDELKSKIEALVSEKNKAITEAGFDAHYTEVYDCPLCRDTGMIDGKRCKCFINKLVGAAYNMSGISEAIKNNNFDTFNEEYYSDAVDLSLGVSPRENAVRIMKTAKEFCKNPEKGDSIIFQGQTGLGKTFLCYSIAKEILDKGFVVLYFTAYQFFNRLADARFRSQDDSDEYSELVSDILDCDLLIIDDLGTELANTFTSTEIFNVLNQRITGKKSTVLSTNLDFCELTEKYGDRIVSRILGNFLILRLIGEDIRSIKPY